MGKREIKSRVAELARDFAEWDRQFPGASGNVLKWGRRYGVLCSSQDWSDGKRG